MENQSEAPTTFRFKFTPEFTTQLFEFAQLHRYDNRTIFKEAWEKWTNENHNDIESEVKRLTSNGYTGSVLDKMYNGMTTYPEGDKLHWCSKLLPCPCTPLCVNSIWHSRHRAIPIPPGSFP